MFSKSIHATVEYETPQTYNWNCGKKAGSLNINKVPELDYDQDASANVASWENCHETFPAWASVRKQGCFRSSLLVLIPRWFLVWLPGISVESNICRVSFGFSFSPGSFHTCAPPLLCFSSLCMYNLCLSLMFPDCCLHCHHHLLMGCVTPGSWNCWNSGSSSEINVLLYTQKKEKRGKYILYFWKCWNE